MSRLSFKLLFFIWMWPVLGFAQANDVSVRLTVDKDTVHIGDVVHIESRVEYGKSVALSGDGLRGLPKNEYLEFVTDPILSRDDTLDEQTKEEKEILKEEVDALVFLDSGWIELPAVVYQVAKNDTTYNYASKPVKFFVAPVIKAEEPPQNLRTIIQEPKTWRDYWQLFAALILLGLAFALFWFLRKRKDAPRELVQEEEPAIPPKEEALTALQELYDTQLWQQQPKETQVQLSQILRRYIEREFKVPALEETTREIERDLRRLSPSQRALLMRLLNDADLVKFAKMTMPEERQRQSLLEAISWVKSNTNG